VRTGLTKGEQMYMENRWSQCLFCERTGLLENWRHSRASHKTHTHYLVDVPL